MKFEECVSKLIIWTFCALTDQLVNMDVDPFVFICPLIGAIFSVQVSV